MKTKIFLLLLLIASFAAPALPQSSLDSYIERILRRTTTVAGAACNPFISSQSIIVKRNSPDAGIYFCDPSTNTYAIVGGEPVITGSTSDKFWDGTKTFRNILQADVTGLKTGDSPTFAGLTANGTIRVAYDGSNYADLSTGSGGKLTIGPTGFVTQINGSATASGQMLFRSWTSSSAYFAMYNNGVTPSSTNYTMLSDASNTWINGVTNLYLRVGDLSTTGFLIDTTKIAAKQGIEPHSMADGSAPNGTIYYSTTASRLVYKDSGGTVNNLY